MKYLVVNDEHELYRQMYADMFNTTEYDVEQIKCKLLAKLTIIA